MSPLQNTSTARWQISPGVDLTFFLSHELLPNNYAAALIQFSDVGVLKSIWIPEQIRAPGYETVFSDP